MVSRGAGCGQAQHLYSGGGSAIFRDFPKLAWWISGKSNPSPKSLQPCLLSLELAGSDSQAPSILCQLLLKVSKIFLPVKAGGADAALGRRRSRRLERVTPRLQFPSKCEGTGCLNTLQLKHSALVVNGVSHKTAFSLPIQEELEGETS